MKKQSIKDISLGPRQLQLGFENHLLTTRDRVMSCITVQTQRSGCALLDEILQHAEERHGIPESEILQHVFWLAQDLKIEFRAGEETLDPHETKKMLLKSAEQAVDIIPTRSVDEAVFENVKQFYRTVAGGKYPEDCDDQYDFSRLLEKRIRRWEISLESIHPAAQQPYFPGEREIEDCLAVLKTLSERRDAFSLITVFCENKEQILKLAEDVGKLSGFYAWHRKLWENLVDSVERFALYLAELRKEPGIAESLERLKQILLSPEPYVLVEEAAELLERVEACHTDIIRRKTEEERGAALEKVRQMLERLTGHLDDHQADADLRGNSLYPIRQIDKRIHTAETIQAIRQFVGEAEDTFDDFWEEIENQ